VGMVETGILEMESRKVNTSIEKGKTGEYNPLDKSFRAKSTWKGRHMERKEEIRWDKREERKVMCTQ